MKLDYLVLIKLLILTNQSQLTFTPIFIFVLILVYIVYKKFLSFFLFRKIIYMHISYHDIMNVILEI